MTCDCIQRWGHCISTLLPIQIRALRTIREVGGLWASIGVGYGKTGIDLLAPMVVPDCRRALLLIPPQMREQLLTRDIPQWSAHFDLPNIIGGPTHHRGRPELLILTYSELSIPRGTALLSTLQPDLIIADEAHNLRHRDAARTRRFLRLFRAAPQTRLIAMTGTPVRTSILDYAHVMILALKDRSPLPCEPRELERWDEALSDDGPTSSLGVPLELRATGQTARQVYHDRLRSTPGIIMTEGLSVDVPLLIRGRTASPPAVILSAIRDAEHGLRPDGELLIEAWEETRLVSQLAEGFFYRWTWPRGETRETIDRWLAARREWHRELRVRLQTAGEHMDSPRLLETAAERWHRGWTHDGTVYPPHTRHPLTWRSGTWEAWMSVRDTAHPETEVVWLSDYLLRDMIEWSKESQGGLIWTAHTATGHALDRSGIHYYGEGAEASSQILTSESHLCYAVSMRAHHASKNLQQHHRNLIASITSDESMLEQLLGRTHRQGQRAAEVTADIYYFLPAHVDAWQTALTRARGITEREGGQRRLLHARSVK
jgi:hypothetical protein